MNPVTRGGTDYDVAPDGEHFVFVREVSGDEGDEGARLILVENFFEDVRGWWGTEEPAIRPREAPLRRSRAQDRPRPAATAVCPPVQA